MKTIPLTNGGETLVDDADYRRLSRYRWRTDRAGYVVRTPPGGTTRMHREILGLSLDLDADHRDGNKLNNQRSNLRPASARQNAGNQKLRRTSITGFKGVSLTPRKVNPYNALIYDHGVARPLGQFPTAEEAARAYDDAAREVFGAFARVNFPAPGEQGCREAA